MPQFLYVLKPTRLEMLSDGPTSREAAIVSEHFEYLRQLVAAGTVFMAGRTLNTDDQCFGIVVLGAGSEAEASALMHEDPAVKHQVMSATLFPYRVALWSAQAPPAT